MDSQKSIELLSKARKEVQDVLYPNNTETRDIDYAKLKEVFTNFLKLSTQTHSYTGYFGGYGINLIPEEISVKYDFPGRYIEKYDDGIYIETEERIEDSYFVITDEEKKSYPKDSPIISIKSLAININGTLTESYYFELYQAEGCKISDYLKEDTDIQLEDDKRAILNKDISDVTRKRTDIVSYLKENKVQRVTYNKADKLFYLAPIRKKNPFIKDDYSIVFPDMSHRIKVVETLYEITKSYYQEYQPEIGIMPKH